MKKEEAVAYCSIDRQESKEYQVLITDKDLIIRTKRHDKSFILEHVLGLKTDKKILLFPTVAGGIIAPLFLVGGINGLGDIWFMVTIAFAGLMALYFGLSGTDVIVVKTKLKEFYFTAFDINPDLTGFCIFFNICLLPANRDQLFGILPKDYDGIDYENKEIRVPEEGIQVTTPPYLKYNANFQLIKLNQPLERGMEFTYKKINESYIPTLQSNLKQGDFDFVEVRTETK